MPFKLTIAGLSDLGRVRRRNEDSLGLAPECGVAVVADGMGGHPGGDVASGLAAATALDRLRLISAAQDSETSTLPLVDAMSGMVLEAHEAVLARGTTDPELSGMGTTLTAILADARHGRWSIGHVGDSRAYLLRHGSFRQLTRDDTWVQARVEESLLTPDQARRHPFGHILTQCLGLEDAPSPQILEGELQAGDLFLLCTDGLTGLLEDEVLADALRAHAPKGAGADDIAAAARSLITMANGRGGRDNITAALIAVV